MKAVITMTVEYQSGDHGLDLVASLENVIFNSFPVIGCRILEMEINAETENQNREIHE